MKRLVGIVQLKFTYFLKNGDMLIHFYVGDFTRIIQQEELMGWHPSWVTRTRIRVIGVNFSEILIEG